MEKFIGLVRRCADDYGMIRDGETIAVAVSGGKDSLAMLYALAGLRRFYPKRFSIHAVTLDMGFEETDFSPIKVLCDSLDVPYSIVKRDIARIIFKDRQEKNPCALCSKMRRGALNDHIGGLGIKKIALAHHFDDAIETFLMSLLYEGRINCFRPVTFMSRSEVTQIRPLLYAGENTINNLASKYGFPVIHNPCPMNGASKREEAKTLLKTLEAQHPDVRSKIFGAMQRLPLEGWEKKQKA